MFLKPDRALVKSTGKLNMDFFYKDFLHLIEQGNEKLALSIVNSLELFDTSVSPAEISECS